MAFAYWIGTRHQRVVAVQNQGELAVLYCFVFLYIARAGAGMWSVDRS